MATAGHQRVGVFAGRALEAEAEEGTVFLGPAAEQRRAEAADHRQRRADRRLLADFHVRDDFVALQHTLDQQFELAAGGLFAKEARLDDARVVEDEQVAGAQQRGQVPEDPIDVRVGAAIEQSGSAAFGGGMLGHQFRRQVEIEIGKREGAHGA